MTSFLPLAFLILAVLGAILFGLATPTRPRRSARWAASSWRSPTGR
jgi:TRAP-type mannitol/chloroaromatic compound transport system permease large subunit